MGRMPSFTMHPANGFTFNGHSDSATVIDAAAAKEIANIALPGQPEFAVSDGA